MAHKAFVSYRHGNDQTKANHLRSTYGSNNTLIDRSLPAELNSNDNDYILGQIRTKHLTDSTVTIVLIGSETYKRKWVDWEIYSSLRSYGDRKTNAYFFKTTEIITIFFEIRMLNSLISLKLLNLFSFLHKCKKA